MKYELQFVTHDSDTGTNYDFYAETKSLSDNDIRNALDYQEFESQVDKGEWDTKTHIMSNVVRSYRQKEMRLIAFVYEYKIMFHGDITHHSVITGIAHYTKKEG